MAIPSNKKQTLIQLSAEIVRSTPQYCDTKNEKHKQFYHLYKQYEKEINATNFNSQELNQLAKAWSKYQTTSWTWYWMRSGQAKQDGVEYAAEHMPEDAARELVYEKLDSLPEQYRGLATAWVEDQIAEGATYNDILLKGAQYQQQFQDNSAVQAFLSADNPVEGIWSFTKELGKGLVHGAKDFWKELTLDDKKYKSNTSMVDQMTSRLLAPTRNEAIATIREKEIAGGAANIQRLGDMLGVHVELSTARNIASMFGSQTADQIRHQLVNMFGGSDDPQRAQQINALLDREWNTLFKGNVGNGTALYDTMAQGITDVGTLRALGQVATSFTTAATLENGFLNADDALATYRTMEAEGVRLQNFRTTDASRQQSVDAFHGKITTNGPLDALVYRSEALPSGPERDVANPDNYSREVELYSTDYGTAKASMQVTQDKKGQFSYTLQAENIDGNALLAPKSKEYQNALDTLDAQNGWEPFIKQMGVKGMQQVFQEQKRNKLSELDEKIAKTTDETEKKKLLTEKAGIEHMVLDGTEDPETLQNKLAKLDTTKAKVTTQQLETAKETWERSAEAYRAVSHAPGVGLELFAQDNPVNQEVMKAGDAYVAATPMRQMLAMHEAAQQRVINVAKDLAGAEKYFTGDPAADAAAAHQIIRVFGGADLNGNYETQAKQAAYALQLAENSNLGLERALSAAKVAADSAKAQGRSPNEVASIARMGLELYNQVVNDPFRKAKVDYNAALARSMDVAARKKGTKLALGARWLAGIVLNKDVMSDEDYKRLSAIQKKIQNGEDLELDEAELVKDRDRLLDMTKKDAASFTEEAVNRMKFDEDTERNIDQSYAKAQSMLDFAAFGAGDETSAARIAAVESSPLRSEEDTKTIYDAAVTLAQYGVDPRDAIDMISGKIDMSDAQKEHIRALYGDEALATVESQLAKAKTVAESNYKGEDWDQLSTEEQARRQADFSGKVEGLLNAASGEINPEFTDNALDAMRGIQYSDTEKHRAKRLEEAKSHFSKNGHATFMSSLLEGDTLAGGVAKAFREQGSSLQWKTEAEGLIKGHGAAAVVTKFSNQSYESGSDFFKSLYAGSTDEALNDYAENYMKALFTDEELKEYENMSPEEKQELVYQKLRNMTGEELDAFFAEEENQKILGAAKTNIDDRLLSDMNKEEQTTTTQEAVQQERARRQSGTAAPTEGTPSTTSEAPGSESEAGSPATTEQAATPAETTTAESTAPASAVVTSDTQALAVRVVEFNQGVATDVGKAMGQAILS